MREDKLDSRTGLYLAEPLDTWLTAGHQDFAIPEAAGSSARVFLLKNAFGPSPYRRDPAFKVMRHDKLAYATPLFKEEFNILGGLSGVDGLTPMLHGGFLAGGDRPTDQRNGIARTRQPDERDPGDLRAG